MTFADEEVAMSGHWVNKHWRLVLALAIASISPGMMGQSARVEDFPTCSAQQLSGNSEAELTRLLRLRLEQPQASADIDAQIQRDFMQRCAVLVMDSSGFSRRSQAEGIIVALAEIERMREVVIPTIEAHNGVVFKVEADNVYAVFPTPAQAVYASQAVMAQLAQHNTEASIGIGYGDLIVLSREQRIDDVYGEEINLASKLGEDLADHGEILVTEAAFEQLQQTQFDFTQWDAMEREISGLSLHIHRWQLAIANPR